MASPTTPDARAAGGGKAPFRGGRETLRASRDALVETTPPPREAGGPSGESVAPSARNLFTGMPPLLMLALGVVIGAAISFAIGVVVWSFLG